MSPSMPEQLTEILQRMIRLESRMVQLGDHVGANLRTKQKIDIEHTPPDSNLVRIDKLDVSLSRILSELREQGITQSTVRVYHGDRCVAEIYPL